MKFKLLVIGTILVALVLAGCGKTKIVKASDANSISTAAAVNGKLNHTHLRQ